MATRMKCELGVGLVELLVALAIGVFLLAGVVMVFVDSKQTYRESDSMGRLQENARYAFDLLSRDLRAAGYQGCVGSASPPKVTLKVGPGVEDSYAWDFTRNAVEGFEALTSSSWSTMTSGTPAVEVSVANIDANVVGGTDVITLRGLDGAGVNINGHDAGAPCPEADVKVTSTSGLSLGDVVLVTNCLNAAVFQITHVNTDIGHNTGTQTPGNATKDLGACFDQTGGELALVSTKSYYIRNNVAGVPSLYRKVAANDPEEMVEGVENMQILYGEDTDSNGRVDVYHKANEVVLWSRVVSVRVSLLVRGEENNVVTVAQSYTYNGVAVTAADRRLRQVYTTTVAIRNRAY